ncbi:MAG: hypothetical protein RLZZ466_454 [Bacteroidota bacterium]
MSLRFSISLLALLLLICSSTLQDDNAANIYTLSGQAQGTSYSIKYMHSHEAVRQHEIDSLFRVFDLSLSRYNANSLLSKLNRSKHTAPLDSHLLRVIEFAQEMQVATKGCFEYRLLPLMKLWGFGSTETIQIPDDKKVQSALELMDSYRLNINNLNSIKSSKHLTLDLDGIAQGYCVDQLSSFLMQKGIQNYVVELGGEIYLAGNDSMKRPWLVGLDDNLNEGGSLQQTFLSGMNKVGITTSGSHQKFKIIGDRYFSHILDPRTGHPVQNVIVTVTVMAPTAMQADALDNAFMVMGIKDSFEWAESHPNIGIYFTYLDVNGEVADTANAYFKQFLQTRNGN